MTSADFLPFVVTHGLHTLFPSADKTSLGTTRFFLSTYLPHLPQLIPSSYWTSVCMATLSLTVASCDFCSSDRRFASAFLQIPLALIIVVAMKRTPLVLAVSFPLPGRIGDFHPLEMCTARHTKKARKSFTDFLASALPYSISFCNPFIQQYLSGTLSWPSVQSHDFLESLLHNMQHLL